MNKLIPSAGRARVEDDLEAGVDPVVDPRDATMTRIRKALLDEKLTVLDTHEDTGTDPYNTGAYRALAAKARGDVWGKRSR